MYSAGWSAAARREYRAAATRNQITLISAMVPFQYSGHGLYSVGNQHIRNMRDTVILAFALVFLYSLIVVEFLFVWMAARLTRQSAGFGRGVVHSR